MRNVFKITGLLLIAYFLSPTQSLAMGGEIWIAEVSGMSCPLCANNIEKQLTKDPDVSGVEVDLGSGSVKIHYMRERLGAEVLIRTSIERAGFTVGKVTRYSATP